MKILRVYSNNVLASEIQITDESMDHVTPYLKELREYLDDAHDQGFPDGVEDIIRVPITEETSPGFARALEEMGYRVEQL